MWTSGIAITQLALRPRNTVLGDGRFSKPEKLGHSAGQCSVSAAHCCCEKGGWVVVTRFLAKLHGPGPLWRVLKMGPDIGVFAKLGCLGVCQVAQHNTAFRETESW